MQRDIKFFRKLMIGIDKSNPLANHLFRNFLGIRILFNLPFSMRITHRILGKKHVIITEILVEDICQIHTASGSCYCNQSADLAGELQFGV